MRAAAVGQQLHQTHRALLAQRLQVGHLERLHYTGASLLFQPFLVSTASSAGSSGMPIDWKKLGAWFQARYR